jgi:hypothetical protein
MKLALAPLAPLLALAELRAQIHFSADTMDLVYHRKRVLAEQVLAGATVSPEFQQAAQIEGVSVETLARTIVSKPDTVMQKENSRRAVVVKLRQAKSGSDLNGILAGAGVPLDGLVSDIVPRM